MALLEMLNSVRGKLREERIQAISDTDLLTTELINLINDAGSQILEENDWDFDIRHDGQLIYPAKMSGVAAAVGTSATPDQYNAEPWVTVVTGDGITSPFDEDAWRLSHANRRSRVVVSGSSAISQTSLIIDDVQVIFNAAIRMVLADNPQLEYDTSLAWETYCNEAVLPATVKEVLSARSEQGDVPLEFVDRAQAFEVAVPRPNLIYSDIPEVLSVGGTINNTQNSVQGDATYGPVAQRSGTSAMVWPIPLNDLYIQYSYRIRHSDLSDATDEWAGVPNDVLHLIEWTAVQMAYDSGIQNDPQRALRVESQVEKRRARALAKSGAQPSRRRVPSMFRAHHRDHSRRRWATQLTPTP
jgi:hypothetical protein